MTQDENVATRVRASFEKQKIMGLLGATLASVEQGQVEITLPFREELTQQHGFLHAGVVTTILDSACGYAALSVMPEGAGVLSIEFKTNLLAPAIGNTFIARGQVVRAGRTIVVCSGDVVALQNGKGEEEKSVATMLATMLVVQNRPGITD
ncbi:MAG TPA: PaaI family thioesterase [Chloroflexia bacterium]|nr:PaaI family thioesterase [Chloroflexia bacterium]